MAGRLPAERGRDEEAEDASRKTESVDDSRMSREKMIKRVGEAAE